MIAELENRTDLTLADFEGLQIFHEVDQDDVRAIFEDLDTNQDKVINRRELVSGIRLILKGFNFGMEQLKTYDPESISFIEIPNIYIPDFINVDDGTVDGDLIFERMDVDASETINVEEATTFVANEIKKIATPVVHHVFDMADVNDDESLTMQEFKTAANIVINSFTGGFEEDQESGSVGYSISASTEVDEQTDVSVAITSKEQVGYAILAIFGRGPDEYVDLSDL